MNIGFGGSFVGPEVVLVGVPEIVPVEVLKVNPVVVVRSGDTEKVPAIAEVRELLVVRASPLV